MRVRLVENKSSKNSCSDNDVMMWILLRHSIVDASAVDKPWDRSTWFMRYSVVLVGRLWGLLAGERTRVSPHPLFLFLG